MPRSARPGGDLAPSGAGQRRNVGGRTGAPYLVPAALAAAAALAAWAGWGRIASCGAALEAPEGQVRKALARQDHAHLSDVYGFRAGGTVELRPVRFDDVTPTVEQGRVTVVAMLSAEGRAVWREEQAALSYLGRERFHMTPCSIALWCAEGDQFDRLRGVLLALFRRHDAYRRRDLDAYERLLSPRYRDGDEDRASALRRLGSALGSSTGDAHVVSWQIRVDRGSAEVGEDVEIGGPGTQPRRERHVYHLEPDGDRWVFSAGL